MYTPSSKTPLASLRKDCQQLSQDFPELFKPEMGCLKNLESEVKFKPDAQPILCKPRMVPFATMEDLNHALDASIQKGVWIPTTFNVYGTPVVPVCKALLPGAQKATLRVCWDDSITVNSQLEKHRHPIPMSEDLMQKPSGGYYFSKIDLAEAYKQIKLAPESQKKLALSTQRGFLLQTHLPYGISSAVGYFQQIMDQLTSDLQGIAVYLTAYF